MSTIDIQYIINIIYYADDYNCGCMVTCTSLAILCVCMHDIIWGREPDSIIIIMTLAGVIQCVGCAGVVCVYTQIKGQ